MAHNFSATINALKKIVNVFDEESTVKKMALLTALIAMPLPGGKQILIYHDLLLYTCAYPGSKKLKQLGEKKLKRIVACSRQHPKGTIKAFFHNATELLQKVNELSLLKKKYGSSVLRVECNNGYSIII